MDVKIDKLWSVKKSVFSCPLVGRGGGVPVHIENCTFYKPMQSQNSTFHLVLWLFSIHFKAYEVTLNMADRRSAVGGRPKLSNMSQVFFSCPRLYKKPM